MIIFDKVTKKYGNSIAAEGISFKVDTGEFIFLVGASGAGKTTILKLINREILPTHGAVFVDNWEVDKLPKSKLPFLRRKVGFIFQDFKLLQDRTVAENIAVSLEILGRGNSDIDGRIREVLKIIQN